MFFDYIDGIDILDTYLITSSIVRTRVNAVGTKSSLPYSLLRSRQWIDPGPESFDGSYPRASYPLSLVSPVKKAVSRVQTPSSRLALKVVPTWENLP